MNRDYRVVQKVLHWLMGIVLMLDLFVAQKFGGEMEIADRLDSRIDHASLGTTLGILFILRLYFRFRHGPVEYPAGMTPWQLRLAHFSHAAMYVLVGALLVTGVITAMNATAPLAIYNALDLTLGNNSEETFQFVRQFHEAMTLAVIGFIALHIVAALYHHFVMRDDSLVRMLRFWRSG